MIAESVSFISLKAIAPISPARLEAMLRDALPYGETGRTARIARGFYISQAVEVLP